MKAFEKWDREQFPLPSTNSMVQVHRKLAWRAALEWTLGEHGPLDKRNNNCDCARARVKKELEDKMKTEKEIKKAIEGMKAIRSRVRPFSAFGNDNLASFDIVLNVLESRMDSDDVTDRYDCAETSEEDLMIAFNAADWLSGEDDDEFDPVNDWPLEN